MKKEQHNNKEIKPTPTEPATSKEKPNKKGKTNSRPRFEHEADDQDKDQPLQFESDKVKGKTIKKDEDTD